MSTTTTPKDRATVAANLRAWATPQGALAPRCVVDALALLESSPERDANCGPLTVQLNDRESVTITNERTGEHIGMVSVHRASERHTKLTFIGPRHVRVLRTELLAPKQN